MLLLLRAEVLQNFHQKHSQLGRATHELFLCVLLLEGDSVAAIATISSPTPKTNFKNSLKNNFFQTKNIHLGII